MISRNLIPVTHFLIQETGEEDSIDGGAIKQEWFQLAIETLKEKLFDFVDDVGAIPSKLGVRKCYVL